MRLLRSEISIWLPLLVGFSVFALLEWLATEKLIANYEKSLRASLFTGFFTLSAFLLTAKTFIVLNMKKEVYGTETYARIVLDRRISDGRKKPSSDELEVYAPLKRAGTLLAINVVVNLLTSVLQITLGLLEGFTAVAVCLAFAAGSLTLVVISIGIIANNLNGMYEHFESEAQKTIDRMIEEREKLKAETK